MLSLKASSLALLGTRRNGTSSRPTLDGITSGFWGATARTATHPPRHRRTPHNHTQPTTPPPTANTPPHHPPPPNPTPPAHAHPPTPPHPPPPPPPPPPTPPARPRGRPPPTVCGEPN